MRVEPASIEAATFPGGKFRDPDVTADGARRASVALDALRTLWFNTGTLCNLTCRNCYMESSPTNDRLAYVPLADVVRFPRRDCRGPACQRGKSGSPAASPS